MLVSSGIDWIQFIEFMFIFAQGIKIKCIIFIASFIRLLCARRSDAAINVISNYGLLIVSNYLLEWMSHDIIFFVIKKYCLFDKYSVDILPTTKKNS